MVKDISQERFVVCIDNSDYPAALQVRKVYRVIPDREAEKEGLIRIVDESGEDYLYPTAFFASISLSKDTKRALLAAR
ncbi:hypothetical protein MYX75_05340 [Acidobacteria bacterium AH-259-A15]|nr:hypothetical protein [Acidobacteria bacterium AH-259-A15]